MRIVEKVYRDRLTLKVGKAVSERMAKMLSENAELFVGDMGRKSAWVAKKRFTQILGKPVEAYPATYDGQQGYYFILEKREDSVVGL